MITLYQAAVLIIAALTLAYMYGTYTRMADCQIALKAVGDLDICRTCDLLEGMNVIVKG